MADDSLLPTTDDPEGEALPVDHDDPETAPKREAEFPVVGIGASAGGLKAIQAFFAALPARPGMAFVVVQHLSPDHESALAQLVQTRTEMAVTQVGDYTDVEPDRVYVIPPGKHLEIEHSRLSLVDPVDRHGRPLAVDRFFRTLAEDAGLCAVSVVLSGTGSDGALGLQAVKERGGLTMAQDPGDADYDGMPQSAIGTGLVDVTGTPAELAETLVRVRNAGGLIAERGGRDDRAPIVAPEAIQAIFAHLQQRTGYNFSEYKRSTILRRLDRRMQVNGLHSLDRYADIVRSDVGEARALLRDFLISVTQFFRDPEAFEALERDAVPGLFEGKGRGDTVRVWVAGCATGEEAYSVAILLCEHRDTLADPPGLQVFATDIDEDALAKAREGLYPAAAMGDLTPERLQQFFDEEGKGIRVKPGLREVVLFARHDVLSDPPFSKLDLVTCRNVLIYLNRKAQARVFAAFHYGLRVAGALFLGSSEGPEPLTKGFAEIDKSARLYRRRDVDLGTTAFASMAEVVNRAAPADPPTQAESLVDRYGQWTLEAYAPPRLLINEQGEVTHVFGRAGDYLRDREGPVTHNVAEKVLRAFRVDLRSALYRASSKGEPTDTPFYEVVVGGETRIVRLHVGPAGGPVAVEGLTEVVFVELDPASVASLAAVVPRGDGEDGPGDVAIRRLELEIVQARERLQATVEEQETSKEELKASNEELQSMNEELQSTTEELETSKEELQSMNEELQTVNQELKNKVEELTRSNTDLSNLIASTEIVTVFLDRRLRVSRFTPAAAGLFNLIPSDIGRPLEHVTHRLEIDDLVSLARGVLSTLAPVVENVAGRDGGGYSLRLLPYRTADGRVEGVVITVVDVSDLRDAREEALRRALQQEAVATLSRYVLATPALSDVFDRAAEVVAEALRAPLAKVLRHDAGAGVLHLEAGVGWDDGAVGTATVPDGAGSQAGYTLLADEPVVVSDVDAESRFAGPDLLLSQGVRSGISVRIDGAAGAWGVLGVHAREPRSFEDADGRFMESVAAVLSAAIRRNRDEATIREQYAEIEAVYETAPVGLAFMDHELRYRRVNRRLADINGKPVEEHLGRPTHEILPDLAREIEPILHHILSTGESVEDVEIRGHAPAAPDDERVWLCSYVPSMSDGEMVGVSIVVRDITDRKRTEEAVRASEERLRLAMRAGRLGTFRRDFVEDTLAFDARCQELYGVPDGEPAEMSMDRVHPDDRAAVEAAVARAVDPADPDDDYDIVHRLLVTGEGPRWLSVQARVQFEGEGPDRQPVEMIGVALDVSAMKEAEWNLEDARARLSLALAVGDAGTYDLDLISEHAPDGLDAAVVSYDEGAQRLLGLPPQSSLEESLVTIHPDDVEGVRARLQAAADPDTDDDLFRSVHRQSRPDGAFVWVASRGVVQFEGEGPTRRPVRLLGTLADISDLREAQEAVRRQLVEIGSYFEAVPVAIAVFDADGRYVRVNGSMEALVGVSTEALTGTYPADLVSTDHVDANEPLLRRVLATGEPIRDIEMRLPAPADPSGGLRDWLLSFVPLLEDGAVTGATLVVQDVTALKRAQASLETLTAELEERVMMRTAQVRRLVGDLTEAERRERGRVAQILHDDLQQLLYAVQFKFEAMRRAAEGVDPALVAQADELVARAIQVTRTLTVDLRPPVLQGEGLDRTFEWLAHRMGEAYGLDVTVDREGVVRAGKTVQVLLFQIVRELLFNVVKHAETASATVRVGATGEGQVRVVVADNGVGFEPEDPTDGVEGGVGLVSVRERIRLVGGSVSIQSAPGGGSEIEIVCPLEL